MRLILFIFMSGIVAIICLPILIGILLIRRYKNNNINSNNIADDPIEIQKRRYNEAQGYYRKQRSKQNENQSQSQNQEQAQSQKYTHTQRQEQIPNHNSVQEHDLSKDYAFIEWLKELQNYNQIQTQNQSQKCENANRETEKSVTNNKEPRPETETSTSFNEKYDKDKRYKCKCGYYVKSKDERSIADFLTENYITFEYEKEYQYNVKLNKKDIKTLHPDFFIKGPVTYKGRTIENVYIEYWGLDTPEYLKSKEYKLNVYKSNNTTLISLYPEDILDCEKSLSIKLTQFKDRQINYEGNNTFRA